MIELIFLLAKFANCVPWPLHHLLLQQATTTYNDAKIKEAENNWGISSATKKVWNKTFDKLLKFQNTPDLSTAARSLCGNDMNETNANQRAKVRVKELETWMKPRLESHPWKENIGKMARNLGATNLAKKLEDEYEAEEDHNRRTQEALFGGRDENRRHSKFTHNWISRDEFIHGVTENIREGKTEVLPAKYISSPSSSMQIWFKCKP